MKKVCLFNYPPMDDFHGYRIETFDPLSYFPSGSRWSWSDLNWSRLVMMTLGRLKLRRRLFLVF
jgi:hypothetical protein